MKSIKKEKTKIMVIDDEPGIREIISILLSNEEFDIIEAESGEDALKLLNPNIDLIILDVKMPGISGYQTSKIIREGSNVPILFLTAMSQNSDLVLGYSAGGDDYLEKPFASSELIARVKGLLRRYTFYQGKQISERKSEYIQWNGLRLDCSRNMAWKDGQELDLTSTEYRILRLLLTHPRQIFSIQNIYESVWEDQFFPTDSNSVMVFIRKLRDKIEDDPKNPTHLVTVWGKGYRIE
jgi:DNA-binding response OmpR family regulator